MMRYKFALLLALCFGCAAQQPQIVLRPVPKKNPPSPRAVTHFLRARYAEAYKEHDRAIHELKAAVSYDSTSATLYSALGRNLNARGRFNDALDPTRRAVRLAPKDLQNRWLYYHALARGAKDTIAALAQLHAIVRIQPRSLGAYDQLLQIYSARGQRAKSLATLDSIVAIPGLRTSYLLAAAENYKRHQAPDQAGKIYAKIIQKEPQNDKAPFELGKIQIDQADTLTAEQTFRNALSYQKYRVTKETAPIWGQLMRVYNQEHHFNRLLAETPMDTLLTNQLGNVLIDMIRNPQTKSNDRVQFADLAERILNRQLQNKPEDQNLLATKARLMLDTGRPTDARKNYRLANLQGEKAEYHLGIAHAYMAEENWASAQQILEALHKLAPPKTRYYDQIVFDFARIYLRQNQIDKARGVYQQAVDAIPEHTGFRYELARTYLFERNWEKAIPILEPLVDDTENNEQFLQQVLFDLGHSLERAGHYDRAVAIFQRLLALNQDHAQASNYLGYMLAEKGERLTEAKKLVQRALDVDPENGAYLDSLGWIYYQLKKYPESMRWLDRALTVEEETLQQTDPRSPAMDGLRENLAVIHEHAGDTAKAMGDHARASRHYERAIEFDPDNKALHNKLKNLSEDDSSTNE